MKLRQLRRFAGCRIGLRVGFGFGVWLRLGVGIGCRHRAGSAKHPEAQRLVLDVVGYAARRGIAAPIGSLVFLRRNVNTEHTVDRLVRQDNISIQVAVLINCPDCLHVLADYNTLCRIGQRQVVLTGGDVIPVAALCGGDVPAVLRVCAAHGERVALDGAHKCKCHLLLRVNRRGKRIGDLTARHRDGDGIRRLDVLQICFCPRRRGHRLISRGRDQHRRHHCQNHAENQQPCENPAVLILHNYLLSSAKILPVFGRKKGQVRLPVTCLECWRALKQTNVMRCKNTA